MSAHPQHNMHEHSLEAFDANEPKFGERAVAILDAIKTLPWPHVATDRGVMRMLGFTDPNKVRPRISELVKAGVLIECDKIKENGRTVRVVRIAKAG